MRLRRYQETDLPKLVRLLNEAYQGRHEFIPYTEAKLQEELQEVAAIWLAVDEQDEIVGMALLRRAWYGEELEVCTRPGQGEIETQLLSAIEGEAQGDEVTVVIDSEDQGRIAAFLSRGYEIDGGLYQLVAELKELRPLPPVPEGYLLRALKPDEEAALIEVVNTAYQGERLRPGVLDKWKSEDPGFSVAWVQVAEYEGQIVAAVVARTDKEFNEHYQARRGYLGPSATLPAHAGKGLGKALSCQAMNFLFKQGMKAASLFTLEDNAAALSIAKSQGFQISHHWKFLHKTLQSGV